MTRDSPKQTLKSGPFVRERRGASAKKWPPSVTIRVKINPFHTSLIFILPIADMFQVSDTRQNKYPDSHFLGAINCLGSFFCTCPEGAHLQNNSHMIVWNPKGIPTQSMENMKWYSPSHVLTAKHVPYTQLTATTDQITSSSPYGQCRL